MTYNNRRSGDSQDSKEHAFRLPSSAEKVITGLLIVLITAVTGSWFDMKSDAIDINTNIATLNANMNANIAELNANINQSKIEYIHLVDRVESIESDIKAIKADYVMKDMFMETLKRIELYIRNLLLTVGMESGKLDASEVQISID